MLEFTNLPNILNQLFNETADKLALTTGFIKRKKKLTFIKAMVLGNLGNGHCSIDNGMDPSLLIGFAMSQNEKI